MRVILNQANQTSDSFAKNGGVIYGTVDKSSVFDGTTLWLTEVTSEDHPTLARKIQNDTNITSLRNFQIDSIGSYKLFIQGSTGNTNIIINIIL